MLFLFSLSPELKTNCTTVFCKRNFQTNYAFIHKQFKRQIFFKASPQFKNSLPWTAPGNHPLYSPITSIPTTGKISVVPLTHSKEIEISGVPRLLPKISDTDIRGQDREHYLVPTRYTLDVQAFTEHWQLDTREKTVQYEKEHSVNLKKKFQNKMLGNWRKH